MTVDLVPFLKSTGESVVGKIRTNLQSTGSNASGKTAASLKYTVTVSGDTTTLRVVGRPYFMTVETGRGPTVNSTPGAKTLVQAIKEWMKAKGVKGSAFGIAKAIHEKGTKLYRKGGRKDIVSNVVNQTLVDSISKTVLKQFTEAYISIVRSTQ